MSILPLNHLQWCDRESPSTPPLFCRSIGSRQRPRSRSKPIDCHVTSEEEKKKLWENSHQYSKISHFWKRTRHLLKWFGKGYVTSPKKRGKVDGKQVFSSSTVWPAFGDGIGFSGIHTPWSTLWKFTCAFDTHTAWCAYVPGSIYSLYWKKGHPIFNRGTLYYVTLFWDWWPSPITWKQW